MPSNFGLDIARIYSEVPDVYDGLSFYVPCEYPLSQRGVQIKETTYELWSPNSERIDFYPGVPLKEPLASYDASFRYHDGRFGPHDWSLHPQHFYAQRPWLGFCLCPPLDLCDWRSATPEIVPLSLVWIPSESTAGEGSLDPEFLTVFTQRADKLHKSTRNYRTGSTGDALQRVLDHRPFYPNQQDMSDFKERLAWTWEELVGIFTGLQRGLREMEAWLTMMKNWGARRSTTPLTSIPRVQPGRIGVWLNGTAKIDGIWLLRIGIIPVYVIHRYTEGLDFPLSSSPAGGNILDQRPPMDVRRPDFVCRSTAEWLNSPERNPYLKVLVQRGSLEFLPFAPDQLQRGRRLECEEKHRARSASWSYRLRMHEHGGLDETDDDTPSPQDDHRQHEKSTPVVYSTLPPVPPNMPVQGRPPTNRTSLGGRQNKFNTWDHDFNRPGGGWDGGHSGWAPSNDRHVSESRDFSFLHNNRVDVGGHQSYPTPDMYNDHNRGSSRVDSGWVPGNERGWNRGQNFPLHNQAGFSRHQKNYISHDNFGGDGNGTGWGLSSERGMTEHRDSSSSRFPSRRIEPGSGISGVRHSGWDTKCQSDDPWGSHQFANYAPIPQDYSALQAGPTTSPPDPKPDISIGELVTEGLMSFWKPPPVAPAPRPPQPGKNTKSRSRKQNALWLRFVEVDSAKEPGLRSLVREGWPTMVLKSKLKVSEDDAAFESETETPDRESGRRTFWDRHNHYRLTFIRPFHHLEKVHYDHSIFGFPLPKMTYVASQGKRGFLPLTKCSTWAYTRPTPSSKDQVWSEPSLEECRPKPPPMTAEMHPRSLTLAPNDEPLPVQTHEPSHSDARNPLACGHQAGSLPHIQEDMVVIDAAPSAALIHMEERHDSLGIVEARHSMQSAPVPARHEGRDDEHDDDEISLGDDEPYMVPMTIGAIGTSKALSSCADSNTGGMRNDDINMAVDGDMSSALEVLSCMDVDSVVDPDPPGPAIHISEQAPKLADLPISPSLILASSLSAAASLACSSSPPEQVRTPSLAVFSSAPVSGPSSSSNARRPLLDRISTWEGSPYPSGSGSQTESSSTPKLSAFKGRRRRGTAKKNRSGHRHQLSKRFGMDFWDLVKVITPEELDSCTPAQQAYIANQLMLQESRQRDINNEQSDIDDEP